MPINIPASVPSSEYASRFASRDDITDNNSNYDTTLPMTTAGKQWDNTLTWDNALTMRT